MSESSEEIKKSFEPDWGKACDVCMETPVVPVSSLCGPCHFGTADALLGAWWDPVTGDVNPDNTGGTQMKGLTVAEVSKILKRFSHEHFKRFMGRPLHVRMEIIKKLAEKGKQ